METKNIFNNQVNKLYIDCGLGENGIIVSALLDALDGFILIMRKNSNIQIDEKIEAAELVLNSNIKKFIETHLYSHGKLSRDMINNINNIKLDMKIEEKLNFCIDISNHSFLY